MKRLTIFSLTCLFSMGAVFAQRGVTQCGVPTGQPKFPLLTYQELPDPTALTIYENPNDFYSNFPFMRDPNDKRYAYLYNNNTDWQDLTTSN